MKGGEHDGQEKSATEKRQQTSRAKEPAEACGFLSAQEIRRLRLLTLIFQFFRLFSAVLPK